MTVLKPDSRLPTLWVVLGVGYLAAALSTSLLTGGNSGLPILYLSGATYVIFGLLQSRWRVELHHDGLVIHPGLGRRRQIP